MRIPERASIPIIVAVVVVGSVAAFGVFVSTAGGQFASHNSVSTAQTTATPAPTLTPTVTVTATPTNTATPTSKDVELVIEHWDNKVGIAINGGEDATAITGIRVEGANMTTTMDMNSEYPKAVGTVGSDTTVRVIATFKDGTTQVVAEKKIN